ncbi:hypothetical protein GF339_00115 [candidate division KSB3 bacterium]|uniref:Hydantoin racemase n=1 Tax=candidate division KSB3 bacterium TaxID=2044937 RepID=A0A9D5JRK5_9BACT|nr:hypothetical protein [candidate division KSB3 bacterium]MBD3322952.1 hypothetical protein [candidate division KSB3 bacterium]
MNILVINPNTSEAFNRKLEATAKLYALESTAVTVISPQVGPQTIEGVFDETVSIPGTMQAFREREPDYDAVILACYSDPLVVAAMRELSAKPVLGIAEASIYTACMLGSQFSIVTTNDRWKPLLREAVHKYGVAAKCASIRTTGMHVADLENEHGGSVEDQIEAQAQAAVTQDGAEVICLGCAGMSGLDKRLQDKFGVPVLDGFVCAIKLLEGFHQYGISHSKILTYATP